MLLYAPGMPRSIGKQAAMSRPRTVRLPHGDAQWVDEQNHPQGFSGVIAAAVKLYREHTDTQRKKLLEAV